MLFIVLPTVLVAAFLLWQANSFFSILRNQWVSQLVYFGAGLIIGNLIFSGRLRFITTFIAVIIGFFLIYRFIDNVALGEFDSFFLSKQFLVFAILFSLGLFLGWGLQRHSFFAIIVSAFFFLLTICLLSKTGEFTMHKIIFVLVPIIAYCIYLIFTANELKKYKETNAFSWGKLLKRLGLFFCLIGLVTAAVLFFMKTQIIDTLEQYGTGVTDKENSMLKKNKDGSVENQNNLALNKNNKRSNELVFCAYINNFFEDSDYPNPLYLTSYYFTKFDTLTETFERDPNMVSKDEFEPNPEDIPLFSRVRNVGVLDSAKSNKMLKEVEVEIYKKRLAASAFLAPSTAYEIQPITVEKDFQEDYLYAYRAKSLVSKLNSAYFIYNSDDEMILAFQKERFKELRKAKSYKNVDKQFLKYYTHFPSSPKFQNFQLLADSLKGTAKTTIDKVIAIRSFFKQKNPLGEAVYSYSDNPGIPGLPGASKLSNFMFETKKGWCTYYAGSTLLMLRAMKIPSRIAVGFLTIDRSDNNKGWYWFYQDQAHAWVQVYFPEYGWLDFDMTIGNDDAQQSPTPDGTPPMQPPKAVVVASGEIKNLDTLKKIIRINANHFIYNETEFKDINQSVRIDASNAKIWRDSVQILMSQLQKEDYLVNVSYDEKLSLIKSKKLKAIISRLPKNIPVDEIYFKTKKGAIDKNQEDEQNKQSRVSFLLKILLPLFFLLLLILALPYLIIKAYAYRFKKSKNTKEKAYRLFRYTTYYLNQMGYAQNGKTLNEFAANEVEPNFNNNYSQFASHYQNLKFSDDKPSEKTATFLNNYFSTFTTSMHQKIKSKKRFKNFLKLNRTFNYLLSYSNN